MMTWATRLDHAVAAREFEHADRIAAFNRDDSALAELGFPVDEYGQPLDGFAQRFNNDFGWAVLEDDVARALRCYQALVERSAMLHLRRAA